MLQEGRKQELEEGEEGTRGPQASGEAPVQDVSLIGHQEGPEERANKCLREKALASCSHGVTELDMNKQLNNKERRRAAAPSLRPPASNWEEREGRDFPGPQTVGRRL